MDLRYAHAMTFAPRSALLTVLILCACGDDTTPVDSDAGVDAGSDADTSIDANIGDDASNDMAIVDDLGGLLDMSTTDARVDSGADAGNACDFVDALDDSCSDDSDCDYFVHQTDCCGNTYAYGVRVTDIDQALAREPLCRDFYPACGCPAMQTLTDSGERVASESTVHVGCIQMGPARVCETYVSMRPVDAP